MKPRKLLERLRQGSHANVAFDDLVMLAAAMGFRLARVSGSHRIYLHVSCTRPLNLQPAKNNEAKTYQVRQFLQMVDEFNLSLGGDE